jgi:hypothetical protein
LGKGEGEGLTQRFHYSDSDKQCKCGKGVSEAWKIKVVSRKTIKVPKVITLLEKWAKFKTVCWKHEYALAGHLGLVVNNLKGTELTQRLKDVHDCRLEIGKLKTENQTY